MESELQFVNKTMADDEGEIQGNSEQCNGEFCDDVKDISADDCHKEATDDAELDDILEGTEH